MKDKLEYSSLVFIIMNRQEALEYNFLISDQDFKKFATDEFLQSNIWKETEINGGNKLRIRKCNDMRDFNRYVKGRYNDRKNFQNQFFTDDDGGILCKNLFNKKEQVYYLN